MWQVVGETLGSAVGAAISPMPLIGLMLIFFSKRPLVNSLAYSLGWVLAMFALALLTLGANNASSSDSSSRSGWVQLVVGLLFLFLAYSQWQKRPRPGYDPATPKWMAGIADMTPIAAFALAVVLLGLNPKNIGLAAAAMTTVANAGLPAGEQWGAGIIWVLIASATALVPTVWVAVAGDSAKPALERGKDWLLDHNAVIMMTLFTLLGVVSLGNALSALTA